MNVLVRHGLVSFLIAVVTMLLVAGSPLYAQTSQADPQPVSPIEVPNPGSDLWRAVRERDENDTAQQNPLIGLLENVQLQQAEQGKTQAKGTDAGSLINISGEQWRLIRTDYLISKGGLLLIVVFVLVGLLFFIKRTAHYSESDQIIRRFNVAHMVGHWMMAASMLFLAVTGLVLLFGRSTLLPLTGSEFFGAFASASKEGHDLFGPIFTFALVVFFFQFVGKNLLSGKDIVWIFRLGGLLGKKPLKVGFFNFGEKILFWLVVLAGLALSISGFAILFQNLLPGRDLMQLATLAHAVVALLLIFLVMGHIYMAISTKGTMDAMTSGDVDAAWAQAHHSSWYDQMKEVGYIRKKRVDETTVAEISAEKTG